MRLSGIHLLFNRALIFSPEKFLATCTTSVPPTSSFPANNAASYAVTRLPLLFAARNPIPFPVGAQHCCAPASHNLSDSAAHLRWHARQPLSLHQLTASLNLLPLFSRLQLFVFNSLQPLLAKHRGWVPLRQPGALCFALAQCLYRPGAVPI